MLRCLSWTIQLAYCASIAGQRVSSVSACSWTGLPYLLFASPPRWHSYGPCMCILRKLCMKRRLQLYPHPGRRECHRNCLAQRFPSRFSTMVAQAWRRSPAVLLLNRFSPCPCRFWSHLVTLRLCDVSHVPRSSAVACGPRTATFGFFGRPGPVLPGDIADVSLRCPYLARDPLSRYSIPTCSKESSTWCTDASTQEACARPLVDFMAGAKVNSQDSVRSLERRTVLELALSKATLQ